MKLLLQTILAVSSAGFLIGQTAAVKTGTVERIKVHGKSLEGNLEGDSPDRDVSIYLPPSYGAAGNQRRYPVVYLLHGYLDNDINWFGPRHVFININAIAAADRAFASGAREMILVMPGAYTLYRGSMYSNSVTTGDWESYITGDLIAYIDSHYRTIADRASRGLAGHSMGGYGTIRLGMKHPEVFSSIYMLSVCCLTANINPRANAAAEAAKTPEEVTKGDRAINTVFAQAAAWSPNPKNPPFFSDLPTKDGQVQPAVVARWAANAPLAMLDQYIPNLKKLKAIAMDVGDQDGLAASIKLFDEALTRYDIAHTFEVFSGDHMNHLEDRVEQKALPFFSNQLSFGR
jgi:S-formylglutathione hydrolase